METKHTTGPWQVIMRRDEDGVTSYQIMTHTHTSVAVVPHGYWGDEYKPTIDEDGYFQPDERMDCAPEKVTNARLIAAAPELLDGLRQAAEVFDSIEGAHSTDRLICKEAVKAIEALIAKATGEQQ